MQLDARTVIISVVAVTLMISAWWMMVRSSRYQAEPRWVRWAWTLLYWLLLIALGWWWLRLPP